MFLPFLKICGITRREDALFCAEAGAGALGVVFYPKSPRNITGFQAQAIFKGLPRELARVGIFVNETVETMLKTARQAGLDTVQMHGEETVDKIEAILREGFHVVQAIKRTGPPLLAAARALPLKVGILVECGRGALPGGTGTVWDWSQAAPLAQFRRFAIAGGLNPQNLAQVARESRAAGFDISSGVELAPGVKDLAAVRALMQSAAALRVPPRAFAWK